MEKDNIIYIDEWITNRARENEINSSADYCIKDITRFVERVASRYVLEYPEMKFMLEDSQECNKNAEARAIQNYKKALKILKCSGPDLKTISDEFEIKGKRLEQLVNEVLGLIEFSLALYSGNLM